MTIKYTKSDVDKFKCDKCQNCITYNVCLETFENMDEHIPYCPKFFNFMLGYKSFVTEQLEWERAHPEEVEKKHQQNVELAKMLKSQRGQKKTSKDC